MKQWWPWLKMRWAQTRPKRLMFQTVLVWRDLKKNLVAGGEKTGCMRLIPILPGVTFFRSIPRRQRQLVRYMSDTSFRIPKPICLHANDACMATMCSIRWAGLTTVCQRNAAHNNFSEIG